MMTKESCSDSQVSVKVVKGRGNKKNYIIFCSSGPKMMNASIYYLPLESIAMQ